MSNMKAFKIKKNTPRKKLKITVIGELIKPKLPLRLFLTVPKYLPYDDSFPTSLP